MLSPSFERLAPPPLADMVAQSLPNRRTGAVDTYMTTTRARYCNHSPPRTTPGPGEATMGRDCLVEAGKGSRNASASAPERDSCRPAGSDSRALPRAKIAFNSDQWSIKLSIVRESLVNVQWQLLERASSMFLESLNVI